ncbi:MAG: tyrosine-protein phosphatase [Raoultibacter sp.]
MTPNCPLPRFGVRPFAAVNGVVLYRSRALDSIEAAQLCALTQLGITAIYDLRKQAERHPGEALLASSLAIHVLEDDLQDDEGRTNLTRSCNIIASYGLPGQRMEHMYTTIAQHGAALRSIIDAALATTAPLLIHCVNGKDRAGVVCACIQRALGVPMPEIYRDYLKTNTLNADMNRRDLARLASTLSTKELAVMAALFEARPAYLDAFWQAIDARYGSFERFTQASF